MENHQRIAQPYHCPHTAADSVLLHQPSVSETHMMNRPVNYMNIKHQLQVTSNQDFIHRLIQSLPHPDTHTHTHTKCRDTVGQFDIKLTLAEDIFTS